MKYIWCLIVIFATVFNRSKPLLELQCIYGYRHILYSCIIMVRKNCVLFMWFHIKLCWKQTNIPILLVFIPELISDLCSFTFSIVSYETINPLKVMFLSLSPIFLTHSHIFFYSILLFSKNLCYLNCRLSSLTNLYLIQIFASILDTGIHTAHWPWALESKHLEKCLLLVVLWDKCCL